MCEPAQLTRQTQGGAGPREPLIYRPLVRSTGDHLDLGLASEVAGGPGGPGPVRVASDAVSR